MRPEGGVKPVGYYAARQSFGGSGRSGLRT